MSDETKLDLEAIEAKCAAATPGPLEAVVLGVAGVSATREETIAYLTRCVDVGGPDYWIVLCQKTDGPADVCHAGNGPTSRANAEFIAHARTDVPALVAEVRRLRAIKCDKVDCDRIARDLSDARAAIELVKMDRSYAQESAGVARNEAGILKRENDALAATVKKLRDDLDEAAGVNVANLNSLRSVRERAEKAEADLAECYRLTGADPDGDDDAMLAGKAVDAVRRLRAEADHEGEKSEEWDRCYAALENLILNGEWTRSDGRTHLAVRVADGADLSCRATRQDSIRSLLAKGGAS